MSTLDADGCLWICLSPGCPELAAGELEAGDLAGAGVSTSWGTGSAVEDEALAGRLAEGAGALAAHLSDALAVSYRSGDFAEAEQARQALAAVGALCAVLRRTAGDAQEHLAGIDAGLPGLVATGQF